MSGRNGFTLLEVMVALVLTGVVALLVYGTIDVAAGTAARLEREDLRHRSTRGWEIVLEDALRNVRSNADYGRATLAVESGVDAAGRPRDRLQFISAGGTPPLTPDADWLVTVEVGEDGSTLTAQPMGVRGAARVMAGPGPVVGLSVRVFGGRENPQWQEAWADRNLLPRAVEVTYWTVDGPVAPSRLVTLPTGRGSM